MDGGKKFHRRLNNPYVCETTELTCGYEEWVTKKKSMVFREQILVGLFVLQNSKVRLFEGEFVTIKKKIVLIFFSVLGYKFFRDRVGLNKFRLLYVDTDS